MNFEEIGSEKVSEIRHKVEVDAKLLEDVVNEIVTPYTQDLDNYVDFCRKLITDEQNPPTDVELDDMCISLAMYLYYAGAMQERLGLKDDISRALHKEMYNNCRQAQEKGTVADKDAYAELASQHEELVAMCYKRAYNLVKAKVLAGQELLSSIKKVISRRLNEKQITSFGGN